MEALETIEMLRRELHIHQNQLTAEKETITGLQQKVVDLGAECERLLKADLKKEVRTLNCLIIQFTIPLTAISMAERILLSDIEVAFM